MATEDVKTPQGLAPAHGSTIMPLRGLWAVIDPSGNIIHTHIGTLKDEVIERFLDEERRLMRYLRGTICPSWEVYEAEGYRTEKVNLVPSNHRIGPAEK